MWVCTDTPVNRHTQGDCALLDKRFSSWRSTHRPLWNEMWELSGHWRSRRITISLQFGFPTLERLPFLCFPLGTQGWPDHSSGPEGQFLWLEDCRSRQLSVACLREELQDYQLPVKTPVWKSGLKFASPEIADPRIRGRWVSFIGLTDCYSLLILSLPGKKKKKSIIIFLQGVWDSLQHPPLPIIFLPVSKPLHALEKCEGYFQIEYLYYLF